MVQAHGEEGFRNRKKQKCRWGCGEPSKMSLYTLEEGNVRKKKTTNSTPPKACVLLYCMFLQQFLSFISLLMLHDKHPVLHLSAAVV